MSVVRNRRGDTLVEVTVALAILSLILLSSTRLAIRAFQQGQTARERTTVALVAQNQLEYLRNFRDNHSWSQFTTGNGATYNGVLNTGALSGCRGVGPSQCFHMIKTADGYVPAEGGVAASVPDSYIELVATPDDPADPQTVSFRVSWGFRDLSGGPENVNHLVTEMTRLVAVTPAPIPPVCVNNADIAFTLDASESMTYKWDDNVAAVAPELNRFDVMIPLLTGAGGLLTNAGIGTGNLGSIIHFNGDGLATPYDAPLFPIFAPPILKQGLTPNVANLVANADQQSDFFVQRATRYRIALTLAKNTLLAGAPGRDKVIVFISDGAPDDVDWFYNPIPNEAAVRAYVDAQLTGSGITVYTIGIQPGVAINPVLQYMASQTGGTYYPINTALPGSQAQFDAALDAVADLLDC